MPGDRRVAGLQQDISRAIFRSSMDDVNLWMAPWSTARWVDVVAAEVAPNFFGLLDREIAKNLIPKHDHVPLSCEQRQLILAGI